MNKFDEYLRRKAAKEQSEIPEHAKKKINDMLAGLPEKNVGSRYRFVKRQLAAVAACIALAILVFLPNVSPVFAKAVGKIPVIGRFVKVITIRNYIYLDENHEMNIRVPKIKDENRKSADIINNDIGELTTRLVKQFYKDLEEERGEGHGSVNADYEVVTNTDDWFTLKLSVLETEASSNTYFIYYHLDKRTGEIVRLGDLFINGDFEERLTEEVKRQMEEEMNNDKNVVYWLHDSEIGEDFISVDEKHNFYINRDGQLVIVFNKYEVAPGYMGCPEFKIDKTVFNDLLDARFNEIM